MTTGPLPMKTLFAAVLSIVVAGCGNSSDEDDTGEATGGGAQASGGASAGGSGGVVTTGGTGQTATGGTTSTGGSTGRPATGGTAGTGATTGSENTGGEQATGGRGVSTGGRSGSGGRGAAGTAGSGGSSVAGSGGTAQSGGTAGAGGRESTVTGGDTGTGGGPSAGASNGGAAAGGTTDTGGRTGGGGGGNCTPSRPANTTATGTGSHEVTVETNSDPGINEGTIFRPADLGGDEKYPIFVWGEGACSQDGLSNATAMAEIASHGYFVVADGTPNGSSNRAMDRSNMEAMGAPLIAYIDWAIAENDKPCSVYYQSLDTTKIASNGFSCGGLMSQGTITDPRITTWGVTSSGMAGANQSFYDPIHTPVLFVEGGPSDMAYDGGLEGYDNITKLGVPVLWFSKDLGHGGDLFERNGGDFTRLNLAWLNWWLKGDETATGKGLLVGPDCPYSSDSSWEVMSANVP